MYLVQKIRAENDVNGNPRRAFIVYEVNSETLVPHIVGVYDVGYVGWEAIPPKHRDAAIMPTVDVPVSEYRSWLEEYATD